MKLGIVTPVLTLLPRAHARWEETAGFDDVVAIVQEADRLGYHHCTCSEHVAVPVAVAAVRGGRYFDPLATFGAVGALTSTIRFAVGSSSHALRSGWPPFRHSSNEGERPMIGSGISFARRSPTP